MERIRQMALQCEDLEMVAAITNEYYDGEDYEEELGNFVPEEDVLESGGQELLYTLSTQYIPSKIVTYV